MAVKCDTVSERGLCTWKNLEHHCTVQVVLAHYRLRRKGEICNHNPKIHRYSGAGFVEGQVDLLIRYVPCPFRDRKFCRDINVDI